MNQTQKIKNKKILLEGSYEDSGDGYNFIEEQNNTKPSNFLKSLDEETLTKKKPFQQVSHAPRNKTISDKPEKYNFSKKYKDNIKKIFDEISEDSNDKKVISPFKLKSLLNETENKVTFSILIKKLENYERMSKDKPLRYEDFCDLFCFDVVNREDFNILFDTIDELGNTSGFIGLQELKQANKIYDLSLTDDDMEIMIKYIGKDQNAVNKEELLNALCEEN